MVRLPPLLLLLLALSGALAAPATDSPFLDGLDEFLSAFAGLGLAGDPLAEPAPAESETGTEPPPEQQVVTEVAPCLGCLVELTADSAELREMAQLAAELLEEELNMTRVTEVTQVYRAAYQVQRGYRYELTLELVATNCSRPLKEPQEEPVCAAEPAAEPLLYAVEIFEPPELELPSQLAHYSQVDPGQVLHLPGLWGATEPTPTPTPATEGPAGGADIEADLLDMISEMERLVQTGPDGGQEAPAAAQPAVEAV
ncbi:uncharacterized protein LOC122382531 [Amphibalanus amphitrite]|uniref:uncharacterized protein LOC122382531 n=1 Tax=Amphibalanus amphitrite TaxID=1232801 RepID=UPI001C903500|nr:uncharacterized protein LOC122382531 [Amphibalanus amphitrite]XP_043223927.1 uncharacterized protein LOC122382531 [Amphibalanus amphitrite]XP_043223928.1 uncharacterized protein LOC122382531 [Amphibalanus amphitrite]